MGKTRGLICRGRAGKKGYIPSKGGVKHPEGFFRIPPVRCNSGAKTTERGWINQSRERVAKKYAGSGARPSGEYCYSETADSASGTTAGEYSQEPVKKVWPRSFKKLGRLTPRIAPQRNHGCWFRFSKCPQTSTSASPVWPLEKNSRGKIIVPGTVNNRGKAPKG